MPDRANAFADVLEAVRAAFERTLDERERQLSELAKAIAVLSFCPGGVRFCGVHWENQR